MQLFERNPGFSLLKAYNLTIASVKFNKYIFEIMLSYYYKQFVSFYFNQIRFKPNYDFSKSQIIVNKELTVMFYDFCAIVLLGTDSF